MTTTTDTPLSTWEQNYEAKLGELLRAKAEEMTVIPPDAMANLTEALSANVQYAISWKLEPLVQYDTLRQIGLEILDMMDHDEAEWSTPSNAFRHISYRLDRLIEDEVNGGIQLTFRDVAERVRAQEAMRIKRLLSYVVIDARGHADNSVLPSNINVALHNLNQEERELKARAKRVRSEGSKALVDAKLAEITRTRRAVLEERELHIAQAKVKA